MIKTIEDYIKEVSKKLENLSEEEFNNLLKMEDEQLKNILIEMGIISND